MRETPSAVGGAARGGRGTRRTDPLPAPPLASGGIVRHGITFTVKPGSGAVAEILASYSAPQAQVNATTRLRRTTLFMHGNRVVRAVEVTGDLGNAMRHVAAQPEVRAVEEAINPYLEEARDFTDATSVPCLLRPRRAPRGEPRPGRIRARARGHPPGLPVPRPAGPRRRRRCGCSPTWTGRRPRTRTSRWRAAPCSCVTTCSCGWSTYAARTGGSLPADPATGVRPGRAEACCSTRATTGT